MRAARSEYDAPSVRKVDASDIGPQHPARYGQNDREIVLGRKSRLFAGSDRGGQRAAAMYSIIVTAKMNNVDPQAWLADVLARIADIPQSQIAELLPWNWNHPNLQMVA